MKELDFTSPRQKNLIPDNDPARFILLQQIEDALRHCWGHDTCADWEVYMWKPESPAFGQCAVTALVVQDFVGGKIIKDPDHDHYWNLADDGTEVDLSREQFNVGVKLQAQEDRTREYMLTSERSLKARTSERYNTLRDRVRQILGE